MKYLTLSYIVIVLSLLLSCNHSPKETANAHIYNLLKEQLRQKEFFKLRALFEKENARFSEEKRLYYKSYLDNAFNRNEACIKSVDALLQQYASALCDTDKCTLTRLQADSYFKLYQYAKAAQNDRRVLKIYQKVLSKEDVNDIKNDLVIRDGLSNIPPQQIYIKHDEVIPWKRNRLGLIYIPVKTKGKTYNGLFDTRANLSVVSRSYAKKLGMRILNVSYNEGSGITGIRFKTGIAVADSLYLGNILMRNVLFQVMPDSILYIAAAKFQINLIVGYPPIEQLVEVQLYKDGRMLIPLNPTKSTLQNFALDGLDPVILLNYGKDSLSFHLDLGATQSVLYDGYFEKYKPDILRNGIKKNVGYAGAGGALRKEVYVLPAVKLSLAGKAIHLDSIDVQPYKIYPKQKFYGNLGQDIFSNFNKMVLNFKYMYVDGR